MTPITIASRSSRAEITAISVYLAYAGRQTDRRTKLKAKPNETRRTSCSGRGLHCVSCAICASSWPCTLEETGGTLISPGSPLNPRLRGSQTFHKKTSRNSSKLLFPTGAFAVHLPSTRRAFTPPMQPENLLRYRCPKNRAPQRELETTTKTTQKQQRKQEEEEPRAEEESPPAEQVARRDVTPSSGAEGSKGEWGLGDVRTGAGVDGVPARVYLCAGPIPGGWTRQHGQRALIGWTGVALLCGGTPRQRGRCISSWPTTT